MSHTSLPRQHTNRLRLVFSFLWPRPVQRVADAVVIGSFYVLLTTDITNTPPPLLTHMDLPGSLYDPHQHHNHNNQLLCLLFVALSAPSWKYHQTGHKRTVGGSGGKKPPQATIFCFVCLIVFLLFYTLSNLKSVVALLRIHDALLSLKKVRQASWEKYRLVRSWERHASILCLAVSFNIRNYFMFGRLIWYPLSPPCYSGRLTWPTTASEERIVGRSPRASIFDIVCFYL